LIVNVLTETAPLPAQTGGPSRARDRLDPDVADRVRARAATLLAAYPLYPTVSLDDSAA
jgi:glycine hydroxymethyltransferase